MPPTLLGRALAHYQEVAIKKSESRTSAVVSYVLREDHPDQAGHDPWLLPLLLVPFLVQFYTRSWPFAIVSLFVWGIVEGVAWQVCMRWPGVGRNMKLVEHRSHSVLVDTLVALFGILLAAYVTHLFAFDPIRPDIDAALLVEVAFITVAASLAGFRRLFYISLGLLVLAIWIAFAANGIDSAASSTLVAAGSVVLFYAWFFSPIHTTFFYNTLYAIPAYALLASLLFGLSLS